MLQQSARIDAQTTTEDPELKSLLKELVGGQRKKGAEYDEESRKDDEEEDPGPNNRKRREDWKPQGGKERKGRKVEDKKCYKCK